MSNNNKEQDKEVYKASPSESNSDSKNKETVNESEKASGEWQDFSISNLNNVEYFAAQRYLPCGCQKIWRIPEPANDDVTLSDDEFICPHTKNSKQ